ncbi:MAG TPA: redox-sensitive transcriptional activator SoxR, partial [Erythrobacter sp.]|nr:redox-sensitive transcriptional activator SoxR [Erythrobacter sp.]
MNANDQLSIGDLARRTGLSASAIRFYEDKGLIHS